MVKLDIILDEPSIDLSSGSQCQSSSVPLSGRVLLTVDKPIQMKAVSLKYECINSHIDLEVFHKKNELIIGRSLCLLQSPPIY